MSEQNNSLSSEKIVCGPTFKLTKKFNVLKKKNKFVFFLIHLFQMVMLQIR